MKAWIRILAALLLIAGMVLPAGAFTAEELDISVNESGAATIDFTYSLSWLERFAVFLKIADPTEEFAKALQKYSNGHGVESVAVDDQTASFLVEGFAKVSAGENGTTIYTTPALNFEDAEKALEEYWFAPLVQADFSPAETRVVFVGKTTRTFQDTSTIPMISVELTGQA
ncbi:hypothetical protein E2N92_00020 [Methanofollis formosanus]|uniref:Uncharacterized protein n=1 Tax=Methanofollis formosanus TaxID=299308 RepID=A0A8G1A0M6_9EURY|nr:hypothetical protein [Methanofollis formosanus]QYZ77922.1 hypothetical protein E2N92_00020 [Methanofollis formosanus]